MDTESEKILISVQAALFPKSRIERADKLVTEIRDVLPTIFDAEPVSLPVPNDVSFDTFPVFQLSSASNSRISLNISRTRVDLIMAASGKQSLADFWNEFRMPLERIVHTLRDTHEVSRVGCIVDYIFSGTNPTERVSRLISGSFKQILGVVPIDSIILRYGSSRDFKGLRVNDIATLKNGSANISDSGEVSGILVNRDINTDQNEDYSTALNTDFLISFFDEILSSELKLEEISHELWQTR